MEHAFSRRMSIGRVVPALLLLMLTAARVDADLAFTRPVLGRQSDRQQIDGTPELGRIGYTQSHGCVRLANWDAARVAGLVGPGTPVTFK